MGPNVPKLSRGDGEAGDVGCSAMLGRWQITVSSGKESKTEVENSSPGRETADDGRPKDSCSRPNLKERETDRHKRPPDRRGVMDSINESSKANAR